MSNTLDVLEKNHRTQLKKYSLKDMRQPYARAFFTALLATPFLCVEFLFIPFLGQILVALALTLTVLYLWRRRSALLAASGFLGFLLSLAIIITVGDRFWVQVEFTAYLILGFCTAVTIVYCVGLAGALWLHYEKGARLYEQDLKKPLLF